MFIRRVEWEKNCVDEGVDKLKFEEYAKTLMSGVYRSSDWPRKFSERCLMVHTITVIKGKSLNKSKKKKKKMGREKRLNIVDIYLELIFNRKYLYRWD